jgi:hypothetical protein
MASNTFPSLSLNSVTAAAARDIMASSTLPPHIYLVAASAFRRMVRERCNQSLIVNGEWMAINNLSLVFDNFNFYTGTAHILDSAILILHGTVPSWSMLPGRKNKTTALQHWW